MGRLNGKPEDSLGGPASTDDTSSLHDVTLSLSDHKEEDTGAGIIDTTESETVASIPRSRSLPAALRMNLSFCGCGFLGIYHLGVAAALARHGISLLLNVQRFCGASAGALIASALVVKGPDRDILEECRRFCLKLAADTRKKRLGVLTPGSSLLKPLESFLSQLMPHDAHETASGRLFISVTELRTRKNHMVSEFASREELIQYLLGSSYVPFVTGNKAVRIDGKRYIDGGMTDNMPALPDGRTILVSPFSGKQEICPEDKRGRGMFMRINQQDFQVNRNNIKRGLHAFFPPSVTHLESYYRCGYGDAVRFLKKEGMFQSDGSSSDSVFTQHGRCQSTLLTNADSIQFETSI